MGSLLSGLAKRSADEDVYFVQFDANEVLESANELVDGVLEATDVVESATDVVESATEVVKVYEVDRYPFSTWDPY